MAFDGLTVAAVTDELNEKLTGGRIYKISQPESDELLITVRNEKNQYKLMLSADASLPLVYLTSESKEAPLTAPAFCMLLRKYLQNARIISFEQPGMERIIRITLEHLNELADVCRKVLIIEIMGKHSNIILTDEEGKIIDSIKRISGFVSSVREVLPGKEYFVPKTQDKKNPLLASKADFLRKSEKMSIPVFKAIYGEYTGISPLIAQNICEKAGVDSRQDLPSLSNSQKEDLWEAFSLCMYGVKTCSYSPAIYYEGGEPKEFCVVPLSGYDEKKEYESVSELLEQFYAEKNMLVRIRQRSGDLRKVLQNAIDRCAKKYDLQIQQMKDTQKREKYKIYGELLHTYGYQAKPGQKELEVLNYYTNEMITIPLDVNLTSTENAQRYFEKYNKQKRTYEALTKYLEETKSELQYLESIMTSLDIAQKEADLIQIKEEMAEAGYVKRKTKDKRVKVHNKPFHYVSSDGFHIYVGKNNYQNEELTFKLATGKDWWFHAKNAPGSHVIIKTEGQELTDRAYEEAAALAAYYSKVRDQDKVEVDYTERRNVKKPSKGAPGFVVYYTNYSMMAIPDISKIKKAD